MSPKLRLSLIGACAATAVAAVAFGGFIGGEAHEPAYSSASRFARADAETAARAACASRAPFVVLDTFALFKPANLDQPLHDAADGRPVRMLHGDLVAAIADASHPGVIPYQTDPIFNVRTLAADFGRLASDIESGRLPKPAAVVSSIVLPASLEEVNVRIARDRPFRSAELVDRRGELLRLLTGGFSPQNPYTMIDRELGRLRSAGVPVFVAAGNTGPDEFVNVLALSDGVYAVGALDRDGGTTRYTSAPGFVSIWSPGYVVLTETADGLSVSGGRRAELRGADLPEQRAVIAAYSGKKARNVTLTLPSEIRALNAPPSRQRLRFLAMMLEPGVYRTQDLMTAYGHSESSGTFVRAVSEGAYMHFPTDTIFRADADGVLYFDPIGDRSQGQLQVADATSFAAPNVCATELFPQQAAAGRHR